MAYTAGPFHSLRSLCTGKETWKIKVRVLRLWEMFPVADPSKPYAINLVLIDAQGVKIEAYIKKDYLTKFRGQFSEGSVYKITYFGVGGNSGAFRASDHEYKIFLNSRTRVAPESSDVIPMMGLSLKNSAEIEATYGECDYLIDLLGLVTAVSTEKQYVKSGSVTRKIDLELTDDKGKVKVALFGNYVDIVKECIAKDGSSLPVVVIQYAKIKSFRGDIVVQNVMNGTKVLWNPDIPEVASFRAGLALHGIDCDLPIGAIDGGVPYVSCEEEFLTMLPRKTVQELHLTAEEGMFIVLAKVSGLLDGEKWCYPSCRCHKSATIEDGLFYCNGCATYLLEVIPRIKIEISDGEETGTFVLFDTDSEHILQRTCKELVLGCKGKSVGEYPDVVKAVIGNEYLFKVEKSHDHGVKFDDSFKVKKICDNVGIIEKFKSKSQVQTPKKLITDAFISKFATGSSEHPMGDNIGDLSGELSEIGPNAVSLDDISPVECSSVLSSAGSVSVGDAILPKPVKRMKLRNIKADV